MDIKFIDVLLVVMELVLCWVKQEHVRGGIKPAVGVTNFVVCLARTVFGNDDNNNGQDTSTF